ncbi:MAG: hypothetical protein HOW73_15820 [Polyangiaceae bacterium]|nr:hypothetical protein [Polyangiaceae bacterium]
MRKLANVIDIHSAFLRCSIPIAAIGLAIGVFGCDGDIETVPVDETPIETTVAVTEVEFEITTDRLAAPAGLVTFEVWNRGEEIHEFLVIRTDLAPDDLPTEEDGSYLEDGPGTEIIDEVEEILPGETVDLTVDLDEGDYVLICNMVEIEEDGEVESHYAEGMHTAFVVTDTVSGI